jgi:prepilin-type N-terminal cleavage/methylation domain-containing protein
MQKIQKNLGFTLLEMIVSLTIFSVLFATLGSGLMIGIRTFKVSLAVNQAQHTADRTVSEIAFQISKTGEQGAIKVQFYDDNGIELTQESAPTIRFQKKLLNGKTGQLYWSNFFYIKKFSSTSELYANRVLLWEDIGNNGNKKNPDTNDIVYNIAQDISVLEFLKKNGRLQITIQATKIISDKTPVNVKIVTSVLIPVYAEEEF